MTVHERKGPPKIYVWSDGAFGDVQKISLGKDCLSLQANKQMQAPSGSFTISLLPAHVTGDQLGNLRRYTQLYRSLRPNLPISIGFQEEGGIMFGLIDRVQKGRTMSGPMAGYTLTITGRDMGKALESDQVVTALVAKDASQSFRDVIKEELGDEHPLGDVVLAPRGDEDGKIQAIFTGKGIAEVAEFLINKTPMFQIPLLKNVFGGSGKPADSMFKADNFESFATWNEDLVFNDSLYTYTGSAWQFLWSSIDKDLYEMWIDTVPNAATENGPTSPVPKMQLMLRPKPFDEDILDFQKTGKRDEDKPGIGWESLRTMIDGEPYHEINQDEILNETLGRSDSQAFSFYMLTSANELASAGNDSEGVGFPLVDFYNARKFPFKSYNGRLSLVSGDLKSKIDENANTGIASNIILRTVEFRNRLFNWYRLNPWFEEGTINVPGRDRFRVGDRVRINDAVPPLGDSLGMDYYTQGVSWSWNYGGHYTSTLRLTRGHNASMVNKLKTLIKLDRFNDGFTAVEPAKG